MDQRKKKLKRILISLPLLLALIALIPAAVYMLGEAGTDGLQNAPDAQSSGLPNEETSGSPEESFPDFLDGISPAGNNSVSDESETDIFTLFDLSAGETVQVSRNELIPAAIACEMDLSAPREALKAQAVACYTLFSRKRATGEAITCDSENWQVWVPEDRMRERWGEDFESNLAVLRETADQVAGQLLEWEGAPILAAYFAISSGATESSKNVWGGELPYLQAVASPGDCFSSGYLSTVTLSPEEFRNAAEIDAETPPDLSGDPKDWLTDIVTTPSGYVRSASLGGVNVSGVDLRSAFSLRSACFQVEYDGENFQFTVEGWGHGVGMSQAGAAYLAKRGKTYREILSYYYPGTILTYPDERPTGGTGS